MHLFILKIFLAAPIKFFLPHLYFMYVITSLCATCVGKRQKDLEKCVAELEENCRGKEAERVDLELRITEVKEYLKKSLAGGALGAPTEKKSTKKVLVLCAALNYTCYLYKLCPKVSCFEY